jgi:hypothetical protein
MSTNPKLYRKDPDPAGSVVNWPFGSGPVIQDYGSADPKRKEIFTLFSDPRHCFFVS